MSILIKGMEMPKKRETITITICDDGIVFEEWKEPGSVFKAIPVPPHGRLIDADALITKFCEWGTRLERGRKLVITMSEAKQAIVDIIEDAPTIIPADPAEDGE